MLALLDRASAGAERLLMLVACVAIALMAVHIVTDVTLRYLLNAPLIGTLEIVSTYYMVAIVFLPLAAVQRSGGHIIVELFTQAASERLRRAMDTVVRVACLALLVVYVRESFTTAVQQTASGEAWEATIYMIPVWPSRWFVPIGLAAMAFCMALQVLAALLGRSPGSGNTQVSH